MNDRNRAYDPDEYFGRATPREVPDVKAEAAERLRQAIAYARLHAPELLEERRAQLTEQAARLLRDHVAGENVDDLMHHWADEWDALTGASYRDDVSDHDCKPGCGECDAWTYRGTPARCTCGAAEYDPFISCPRCDHEFER